MPPTDPTRARGTTKVIRIQPLGTINVFMAIDTQPSIDVSVCSEVVEPPINILRAMLLFLLPMVFSCFRGTVSASLLKHELSSYFTLEVCPTKQTVPVERDKIDIE